MSRLASRLGVSEGQAWTLAIGMVVALLTAIIGIPPTLEDRPERPAESPPGVEAPGPLSPTPSDRQGS